jgi:DNA-binding NarL/FixJ family response regulator
VESESAGPQPSSSVNEKIRVFVVDDHQLFASSLAATLAAETDMVVVGVANDITGAESALASAEPDVVLLDHRLPDGDGVAAIGRLSLRHPAQFVMLTASTAEHVLIAAIDAGAAGFISKSRSLTDLTTAVRAAAAGEAVISPELLARLLPRLSGGRSGLAPTKLTPREIEVLQLVARGMSNAAIADELVVSVHTVRNHVANLSSKLAAHSKLEAVSIGLRKGIISVP